MGFKACRYNAVTINDPFIEKLNAEVTQPRREFARRHLKPFPARLVEDEGRLKSFAIREHFLIRLYLLAELRLLEAWALRQGNGCLLSQSLLNPYPRGLVEVADSGKGRDLL